MNNKKSFDYHSLHLFSQNFGMSGEKLKEYKDLMDFLKKEKDRLNFPSVHDDVGRLLHFLTQMINPDYIFEFGSGFGLSSFWYLTSSTNIKKVYLTERRDDLTQVFDSVPWPVDWKEKIDFHWGDAHEKLSSLPKDIKLDLVLVDGEKATYLPFLESVLPKCSDKCVIVIDNAFNKGDLLRVDPKLKQSRKVLAFKSLYDYLEDHSKQLNSCFLPFSDGVLLLTKC